MVFPWRVLGSDVFHRVMRIFPIIYYIRKGDENMWRKPIVKVFLFGVLFFGVSILSAHAQFQIKDLGTLGSDSSTSVAVGINNSGEIVGASEAIPGTGLLHAVLWTKKGKIVDLGSMGGNYSVAHRINNRGQVIGNYGDFDEIFSHFSYYKAFLWEKEKMIDLLGEAGGQYSEAWGINEQGQIVGWYYDEEGHSRAFIWGNGKMINLGMCEGCQSQATGINNLGQVVGFIDTGSLIYAVLWEKGNIVDLGLGDMSIAEGINNRGQIVGNAVFEGTPQPFVWSDGKVQYLGTLGGGYGEAISTNDDGWVVGGSETADGDYHAFLWSKKTGMIDLGNIGNLSQRASLAWDINNRGQIVGFSDTPLSADIEHAVLWIK
jgi:probable HAF family extracellular repeat protein